MLTAQQVEQDFKQWQARLDKAQQVLVELPKGRLPYPEHKKREKRRRQNEAEIQHVKGLFRIAREGLRENRFHEDTHATWKN